MEVVELGSVPGFVVFDLPGAPVSAGGTRLAAHLIELASTASPASADIQTVRAKVYAQCAAAETSLIGKAIFEVYRRDAEARSSA